MRGVCYITGLMGFTFCDKLAAGEKTFSFEFFPPKSPEGWAKLYETIARTAALSVDLVSVTYGAGGATRDNTVELTGALQNNLNLPAMAHLTCLGHSRDELAKILNALADKGIPAIMALRGDPPKGETHFEPHPQGFAHANELIEFIRQGWPQFKIGCAAYPEGHPESFTAGEPRTLERDIGFLKRKQDAGADYAMTQLFFDNAAYYAFVEQARVQGVTIPLIPGIMPMTSAKQIDRFVALSDCSIPASLRKVAAQEDVAEAGFVFALEQCKDLLANGAPGVHLYTLNNSGISARLLEGLRTQ